MQTVKDFFFKRDKTLKYKKDSILLFIYLIYQHFSPEIH